MPPWGCTWPPGETGRYRLSIRSSGESARSESWEATVDGGRLLTAVVKILPCETEAQWGSARREMTTLARAQHPNLPELIEAGEFTEGAYTVVRRVPALRLVTAARGTRSRNRSLGSQTSARIGAEVAAALHHLHELDLVHAHFGLGDILIGTQAAPPILLGLGRVVAAGDRARLHGPDLNGLFESPEQREGLRIDRRSDVFALGALLYSITTRMAVDHDAFLAAVVQHRLEPPSRHATVSDALEAVILRALEPRRDDRYETANEMARDLDHAARGASVADVTARVRGILTSRHRTGVR